MEYNKPKSMSHKDYLVRTLSVKLAMSEKIVEAVVNHQFTSANEALDSNKSIELSGFGRLIFNEKKAIKKLAHLQQKLEKLTGQLETNSITGAQRKKAEDMIPIIKKQIAQLKPRINHD